MPIIKIFKILIFIKVILYSPINAKLLPCDVEYDENYDFNDTDIEYDENYDFNDTVPREALK